MSLYPIFVDAARCRVLVVGGGAVACRKVRGLLEAGARPEIVSPALSAELAGLVETHALVHHARVYQAGDALRRHLVFAATDSAEVNAAVAAEAEGDRALASVADDGEGSAFHVPAVIRRDGVTVALSTGGAAPLLAKRLRERLEDVVTEGVGRAARRLVALRTEVQARWPGDEGRRRAMWTSLVTPAFLDDAVAGRDAELETRIARCLSQS
ncbi:MAG: uroporphyrinogen-III C-methyltransferase [Gemmatimonadetes bacterium]|nr:uroporphyrinogen-III C-methyltransferase [Gemmatimonadota bacterium]